MTQARKNGQNRFDMLDLCVGYVGISTAATSQRLYCQRPIERIFIKLL